ncbi:hypothetical protein [Longispora albida]|uniref:hypothetical protein n=1 Tax=Longispora albida TaxID=203523 RepID=UPI0003685E4A|nr:hypothetical protein [Longispora albida]
MKTEKKRPYDTTVDSQAYPDDAPTAEAKRRGEHATAPSEGPDDPEYTGEKKSS